MTNDNEEQKDPLQTGLDAVADSPMIIAAELRLMAAGDDRYSRFTYMSPWIKNIWNAAADIIEEQYKNRLH